MAAQIDAPAPAAVEFAYLASEAEATALLAACSRIVHLKGFGETLLPAPGAAAVAPPQGLLAALAAADAIVWDGDFYHARAFTSALPAALAARCAAGAAPAAPAAGGAASTPLLLALGSRCEDQQAAFRESWRSAPFPRSGGVRIACLRVGLEELPEADLGAAAAALPALRHCLDAQAVTASQRQYAALGLLGVRLSTAAAGGGGGSSGGGAAAPTVLCWGGHVPAIEFAAGVAHFGSQCPVWRYFHAERLRVVGGAEVRQQGLLQAVAHPKLVQQQ
jgi:hypothetical protein